MKKSHSLFLAGIAACTLSGSALAVTVKSDQAAPAAAAKPAETPVISMTSVATAPAAPPLKLDDYIIEVSETLQLTDAEKKLVQDLYYADQAQLKKILNNGSLSTMQKVEQVADLRRARNARIIEILGDLDRQHAFEAIDAKYRIALVELAAVESPAAEPAAKAPEPAPAKK